jgi:RNA polymerase sigma-70 factor (ECF subfamily)
MKNVIKQILKEEYSRKRLLFEDNEIDFNNIYNNLWDFMLNSVCSKYTKDRNKAKDFCQNGFVKVYNKLHQKKYDGEIYGENGEFTPTLKSWVRRVISNNILDELRKNKMSFVDNSDQGFDFSRLDTKEEEYEEPEHSVEEVERVLPMLSPAYRRVFELYHLEGLKHSQIAKKLGISDGTSKSNFNKARKKIKDLIERGY